MYKEVESWQTRELQAYKATITAALASLLERNYTRLSKTANPSR